jgi:CRISPR-associated endoribonuclease Cas6
MRIKIELSSTTEKLPINNQHLVNSFIHRVLGNNNSYHDTFSKYCVSQLCGGRMNEDKQTLSFTGSPFIIVTSDDMVFINKIIVGLLNTKDFGYGITFKNISFIEEKFYDGWNHFFTLSPIIIKERDGEKYRFVTVNDSDYTNKLKNHILNKLSQIDSSLDLSDFELVIGDNLKKVKKILVKNVINHASVIKFSVKTNKKVAAALYNNGVGQSTGSGFGTIYKTENVNQFKF